MATDDRLHTIRFKRGDTEFELTSTREDVARAWGALDEAVIISFAPAAPAPADAAETGGGGGTGRKRRTTGRKKTGAAAGGANTDGAQTPADVLAAARIDDFPEIGDDPPALMAGYAVLQWA